MPKEDSNAGREDGGGSRSTLSRRAVLGLSAAAAASGLGLTVMESEPTAAAPVQVPTVYSYDGSAVVQGGTTELVDGTVAETEPNDERSAANRVPSGGTVSATLDSGEVDWFTFAAAVGDPIRVVLDRESSNGAVALLVYDSDGRNIDFTIVGGDSPTEITHEARTDGMYFTQLVDIHEGSGDYTLSVTAGDGSVETPTETPTATPTETPTTTPTPIEGQSPYGGTARTIPGRIQMEDFDVSEGDPTYYDTTSEQKPWSPDGPVYRDTAVDIEASQDSTNDYSVGYLAAGEWLEYTVDVEPGTYELHLRTASARDSGTVRLSLGGTLLAERALPVTGGWFTWETASLGEHTVESGTRDVLRLDVVEAGMNLNWLEFRRVDSTTETPTTDPTATPTTTPGSDRDFGEQAYGMYGYGGVRE
ncbi:carbohydrate-binding domain-containing protein [Halomarina salina]|uniref:Carbohydrate-binding domain-containing protein n=1 Tax=Halomarina salina TaxID=1872699 RepID=A0ABD5RHS6_9EURY|nr:carbohydrate-binding domain-containing protein [Halomarina salina]